MKLLVDLLTAFVAGALLYALFRIAGVEMEGFQVPIVIGGTSFICFVLSEISGTIKKKIDAKRLNKI